jgi:hypothetical protein
MFLIFKQILWIICSPYANKGKVRHLICLVESMLDPNPDSVLDPKFATKPDWIRNKIILIPQNWFLTLVRDVVSRQQVPDPHP